jgi:hypothetical protein
MVNDPRTRFYPAKPGREQTEIPSAAECPATKQTARLNWKDFRLRATLYVTTYRSVNCYDDVAHRVGQRGNRPGFRSASHRGVRITGPHSSSGRRLAEAQTGRRRTGRKCGADRACVCVCVAIAIAIGACHGRVVSGCVTWRDQCGGGKPDAGSPSWDGKSINVG